MAAFGRDLLEARLAGRHPERAWIISGRDWSRRPRGATALCVASDWLPGTTDWWPLAGLPVHVVDRGAPMLLELAAEVAAVAAPVVVHRPCAEWTEAPVRVQEDIAELAWAGRHPTPAGFAWPPWWSDAQDEDYRARRAAYFAALAEDIGSEAA
jgi:hypothetical protein